MAEIKFASKDGILYKGEIQDFIELTKSQKAKLKVLASQKTSAEIEEHGLELVPEDWQEKAIIERIKNTTGYNKGDKRNILDVIQEVLRKGLVIISTHATRDRMPDPSRHCLTQQTAITRLLTIGKVTKFKAKVDPKTKEVNRRLAYTVESELDSGRLAIAFPEDKRIFIITVLHTH